MFYCYVYISGWNTHEGRAPAGAVMCWFPCCGSDLITALPLTLCGYVTSFVTRLNSQLCWLGVFQKLWPHLTRMQATLRGYYLETGVSVTYSLLNSDLLVLLSAGQGHKDEDVHRSLSAHISFFYGFHRWTDAAAVWLWDNFIWLCSSFSSSSQRWPSNRIE